ncbi:MAG: folate family ECF transporter S component [Clostridia bacterium]|nr:folate family ECF transporter S component [Clostridia bacterium]
MSQTQQEIATPKACKKYSIVICGVLYAICAACLTAILLLTKNPVHISMAVVGFAVIASVITFVAFGRRFFVAMGTAYALIAVICADLVWYFLYTMTDKNKEAKINSALLSVGVSVLLIALITVIVMMHRKNKANVTTRYITYTASFAALSIICKMISNTISTVLPVVQIKLSIVYIPWTISGIVLGPVGGVLSALLGDVIGQVLVPTGGSVLPLTLVSNSLFPLFPALMYRYSPIKNDYVNVAIGLFVSMLCCTLGIGTYSLYQAYYSETQFGAYFLTRLWQVPVLVLNCALIISLLPPLKRLGITELFSRKKVKEPTEKQEPTT